MLRHDRLQALGGQRKWQRAACVASKAAGTAMQPQTAPLQQLARRHVGGRRQPQPRLRRPCLERFQRQTTLQLKQATPGAGFKPG